MHVWKFFTTSTESSLLTMFIRSETNINFMYQWERILKKYSHQWSTFKIDITKVPLLFDFLLFGKWLKSRFVSNIFRTKKICAAPAFSIQLKFLNSLLSAWTAERIFCNFLRNFWPASASLVWDTWRSLYVGNSF